MTYSGILEEMTIDDVRGLKPNVGVVPIGSTEPHGPALPYGTDSFQVTSTAYGGTRRANELGGRVVCLPTQRISLNNNFYKFPFACRMQVPTFMSLLKDLVDLCEHEGVHRIVFVNGHGGNPDVIRAVQRDLAAREGLFTCLIGTGTCASEEARSVWENRSDHAGEEETSQVLYLRPDLVREDQIKVNPQVKPKLEVLNEFRVEFVRPWHLYIPASAGGDATKASAEKGKTVLESAIEGTGRFLAELSKAPESDTFPY
ncbi:MAG: creatininase family protein [bacterium]|nr:creatininase family protein [bacterium]